MQIEPKFVNYDIRRMNPVSLITCAHENDVDTQVLDVRLTNNGERIELSADYTYTAAFVDKDTKALIDDSVACSLSSDGNVRIPIDNLHQTGAKELLIELTVTDTDGDQVLVTPFPLWVKINASILDTAQVTPESLGTVPELLEEAKGALETVGDYENLENKPQINGHELFGNKTGDDLGLQGKLTAGENVTIDANGRISATGGTDDYEELNNKPKVSFQVGQATITRTLQGDLRLPEGFSIDASVSGLLQILINSIDGAKIENDTLTIDKFTDDSKRIVFRQFNDYYGNDLNSLPLNSVRYIATQPFSYPGFIITLGGINRNQIVQLFIPHNVDQRHIPRIHWRSGTYTTNYSGQVNYTYGPWWELSSPQISSATVNQNGTITFTMSDGSTVTTTGESVIGPQGPAGADGNDYVLTAQDKTDIANIVLSELPTTQGVQYGNTSN